MKYVVGTAMVAVIGFCSSAQVGGGGGESGGPNSCITTAPPSNACAVLGINTSAAVCPYNREENGNIVATPGIWLAVPPFPSVLRVRLAQSGNDSASLLNPDAPKYCRYKVGNGVDADGMCLWSSTTTASNPVFDTVPSGPDCPHTDVD